MQRKRNNEGDFAFYTFPLRHSAHFCAHFCTCQATFRYQSARFVKRDAKQSKWRTKYKVHRVADVLPMMPDDELDELAQDIKTNGQRFPITRAKDDTILDGRNRLEACERAGIEPKIETKDVQDSVAFILSANIARRHLSKGQQAMIVAKIHPEPDKGGRGQKSSKNEEFPISSGNLSMARTVLKYARELADNVLSGTVALNNAYDTAQMRKRESETSEERLRQLRESDPDLADLVVEERLTLSHAEVLQEKRQKEREDELRIGKDMLGTVLRYLAGKSPEQVIRIYIEVLPDFDLARLSFALQSLKLLVEEKTKQLASKLPAETEKPKKKDDLSVLADKLYSRHREKEARKNAASQHALLARIDDVKFPKLSRRQRRERRVSGSVHQRFADMLAVNNYCTPVQFVTFARAEGWLAPEWFGWFEEIPEKLIKEFMKPNNWKRITDALAERAAMSHEKTSEADTLL